MASRKPNYSPKEKMSYYCVKGDRTGTHLKNNVAWIIIAALIKVLKHAENAGSEHSCFICVCVNVHV